MGLNFVEIIMEVEDRFGIQIEDGSIEHIRTVRDLAEHIRPQLHVEQRDFCLSNVVSNRLQRALMEHCGLTRLQVDCGSRIDDLVPVHQRRQLWTALEASTDLQLPELLRPPRQRWLVYSPFIVAGALALAVFAYFNNGGPWHLLLILLVAVFAWAALPLVLMLKHKTRDHAVHVPKSIVTFGDLADLTYRLNRHRLYHQYGMTEDEIYRELVDIISSELGLKPEEITPDSDIIKLASS